MIKLKFLILLVSFFFVLINFSYSEINLKIIMKIDNQIITNYDLEKEANLLDSAVQKVLDDGLRTKDIMSDGKKLIGTKEIGNAIISKLI